MVKAGQAEWNHFFEDIIYFAKIMQKSPPVGPRFLQNKDWRLPRACGLGDVAFGKLFLYQGVQRA